MTDRGFTDTTLGLLRAAHMLEEQRRRRQGPPKRPTHSYEKLGTVVHAKRCLTASERSAVNGILLTLRDTDPSTDGVRVKELLADLGKHDVRYVQVKRATKIDYSKSYPYASKKRLAA